MINALTPSDAAAAAALSAGFGWPHRLEDWSWFLELGQGVAWREHGALLGTAMVFALDPGHASIGLVQVAPALQGRGIGRHLMQAAIALGGARSLLLHATPEGAGLYASLGFAASYTVHQWQGTARAGESTCCRMATAEDLPGLAQLDAATTGLRRDALLRGLLKTSAVAISGPAGAPTGYAMRRTFGRGALIGPLVATNEAEAIELVTTLQGAGFLRLDLIGHPLLLEAALSRAGLVCIDEVQAMVRGTGPKTGPERGGSSRLFGLASQASG